MVFADLVGRLDGRRLVNVAVDGDCHAQLPLVQTVPPGFHFLLPLIWPVFHLPNLALARSMAVTRITLPSYSNIFSAAIRSR